MTVAVLAGETNRVAKIELNDQYDKTHTIAYPQTKMSVLTIADRPGSAQLDAWVKPIREKFGESVEIYGLADVAGVPRPIRPFVVGYFKDKIEYPVLLDWDGKTVARFGYARKQALLLVIDQKGEIRHRVSGAADATKLAALFGALRTGGED
jgi:hypothetical protein